MTYSISIITYTLSNMLRTISDLSIYPPKCTYFSPSFSQLNTNLTANNNAFRFGYDSVNDQYGYYREVDGADTLVPFKSEPNIITRDYSIGLSARFSDYGEHTSSTSKDIGIEGYRPISAGFVSWYAGGGSNTANISGSVSLNNNIVTLTLRAIANEVTVGGTHTVRVTYIED